MLRQGRINTDTREGRRHLHGICVLFYKTFNYSDPVVKHRKWHYNRDTKILHAHRDGLMHYSDAGTLYAVVGLSVYMR